MPVGTNSAPGGLYHLRVPRWGEDRPWRRCATCVYTGWKPVPHGISPRDDLHEESRFLWDATRDNVGRPQRDHHRTARRRWLSGNRPDEGAGLDAHMGWPELLMLLGVGAVAVLILRGGGG